ncbi:MAG: GspMb/PilO family protein [Maricaulaceae bacterium]|jgi:hypothetical protein
MQSEPQAAADASGVLERLAAIALAFALVAAAGWSLTSSLRQTWSARDAAQARLDRYAQALSPSSETTASFDLDEIAARHRDDAEAQLALQAALDRLVRSAGLAAGSVRPLGPEVLGDLGRVAWVEVSLTTDLQGLTDVLAAIDRERPLMLLRALEVQAGSGARSDENLRIRLEAGRAWRAAEAPA